MKTSEIPAGNVWRLDPPKIEAMITGVDRAAVYPDGRVVLVYEDGSKESAQFSQEEADAMLAKQDGQFFAVVSAVQGKRLVGEGK